MEKCAECKKNLQVNPEREECMDMCDDCYNALQERVERMSDRNYRMEVARAARTWLNDCYHRNHKEAQYRVFFATVMPEKPQHEVEKFIRENAPDNS